MEKEAKIEYKLAETEEERQAVFALRYKVYCEEMGFHSACADHKLKILKEPLDDCRPALFYASMGGNVIATICTNFMDLIDNPAILEEIKSYEGLSLFIEAFPLKALSFTGRLMVLEHLRNSSIAGILVSKVFEHGKNYGVLFDFIAAAPSLVELYEQLGYRRYANNFFNPEFGYRVPMVLLWDDIEHLQAVHSPFLRIAKKYKNSRETAEWFNKTFSIHTGHINKRLVSTEEFWETLSERYHIAEGQREIPLLAGLTEEEKHQFLDKSTVLHCQKGDHIIQQGETGDEMFVLLSGAVDILEDTKGKDGKLHTVATFGPGEIFGEMAFVRKQKRAAHVIAQMDADVLVLTQTFLRRSMKNHPEVTAKVLLNLSVILCDRLGQSTENWMKSVRHNKALRYLAKNFKQ